MAGELGHLSIDASGPLCPCGLRGCLNTLIGTEPLLARARGKKKEPAFDNLDALLDAALAGDALAVETLDYAGRQLGLGLAMLLNLANPAVVVIGGGIVRAGELLLGPLRQTVARHSFSENFSHARILPSRLNDSSTARGAATLILDAALEEPLRFFPAPRRKVRLAS